MIEVSQDVEAFSGVDTELQDEEVEMEMMNGGGEEEEAEEHDEVEEAEDSEEDDIHDKQKDKDLDRDTAPEEEEGACSRSMSASGPSSSGVDFSTDCRSTESYLCCVRVKLLFPSNMMYLMPREACVNCHRSTLAPS
ncbi:hypothetical protein WMY93_010811 [Mugilogobius chulae]|uniref:Uncharacterized protein n=1 Tax=Mugilogobius chulae TaxID=88201 RepID=A0AAW0PBY3_9GOBI